MPWPVAATLTMSAANTVPVPTSVRWRKRRASISSLRLMPPTDRRPGAWRACRDHQQRHHPGRLVCRCQRILRRRGGRLCLGFRRKAICGGGGGRCDRHNHQYRLEQHRGLFQCARNRRRYAWRSPPRRAISSLLSSGSGNALASLENTGAVFATAVAYAKARGGGTSEGTIITVRLATATRRGGGDRREASRSIPRPAT